MEKPLILVKSSEIIIQIMLVLSVALLLRGHNEPGGGFIAALLLGISFFLYIFFHDPSITAIKNLAYAFLCIGLFCLLLSVFAGMIQHKPALTAHWFSLNFLSQEVKLGTPLLFDIGVYLCVTSTLVFILLLLKSELYDYRH